MNDIFWFLVVLMFANILLIKFKVPIISFVMGFVTLAFGIMVLPMSAVDIPLNPTFAVMTMMVSLIALVWTSVTVRRL